MADCWKCADCGALFEEPEEHRWVEDHGDGMLERWVEICCPVCGSTEIDECWEESDDASEDSV